MYLIISEYKKNANSKYEMHYKGIVGEVNSVLDARGGYEGGILECTKGLGAVVSPQTMNQAYSRKYLNQKVSASSLFTHKRWRKYNNTYLLEDSRNQVEELFPYFGCIPLLLCLRTHSQKRK